MNLKHQQQDVGHLICAANIYFLDREKEKLSQNSPTQLRKVSDFGVEKWDGTRLVMWG